MRFSFVSHSVVSDWNHGNAHFLRGVACTLKARGHEVRIFEPADGWSRRQLIANEGPAALERLEAAWSDRRPVLYSGENLDPATVLGDADAVIVHEWTPPALVRAIGAGRRRFPRAALLFHDTHHRAATDPVAMAAYDLSHYDGVLASGRSLAQRYLERGWTQRAWVWHEAADTTTFAPRTPATAQRDLVWIGNWGDDERGAELREFRIGPVPTRRAPTRRLRARSRPVRRAPRRACCRPCRRLRRRAAPCRRPRRCRRCGGRRRRRGSAPPSRSVSTRQRWLHRVASCVPALAPSGTRRPPRRPTARWPPDAGFSSLRSSM